MQYRLSPAAQADLAEIWNYSRLNWGEAQAERYVLGIRGACEALASDQLSGQAIDKIRPGHRRLAVGSHRLFCRLKRDGVEVIRSLHRRMDAAARLPD